LIPINFNSVELQLSQFLRRTDKNGNWRLYFYKRGTLKIKITIMMFSKLSKLTVPPSRYYPCVDESSSISSTVTANNSNRQKQLVVSPAEPLACVCTIKKVVFDLDKNERYENKTLYKDEVYGLWYSSQEYKSFRRRTAKLAQAMSSSPDAYRAGNVSYAKVMTRTYVACCEAVQETEQVLTSGELKYLMQCVDPKLVGLDKWSIKAVAQHRSERRAVIRNAVIAAQEEPLDYERLRATSENISLASRLYARTVAVAIAGDIRTKDTVKPYSSFLRARKPS
jgi:hypothetical protein